MQFSQIKSRLFLLCCYKELAHSKWSPCHSRTPSLHLHLLAWYHRSTQAWYYYKHRTRWPERPGARTRCEKGRRKLQRIVHSFIIEQCQRLKKFWDELKRIPGNRKTWGIDVIRPLYILVFLYKNKNRSLYFDSKAVSSVPIDSKVGCDSAIASWRGTIHIQVYKNQI